VVDGDSKNIPARTKIAEAYVNTNQYDKASEVVKKILELNPKSHEGTFLAGRIHLARKEYNDASPSFNLISRKILNLQAPTISSGSRNSGTEISSRRKVNWRRR